MGSEMCIRDSCHPRLLPLVRLSLGLDEVESTWLTRSFQDLKPKSLDVRQEELGAMVDKEMAATSAAIEDAVRRIEVRAELLWELRG